jgi:hypothetical protein
MVKKVDNPKQRLIAVYSLVVFKFKDIGIVINIKNFYNILTSITINCFKHILNTQIFIILILRIFLKILMWLVMCLYQRAVATDDSHIVAETHLALSRAL